MPNPEIHLYVSGCYAVWRDEYGQIKQVAEIPPSIGGKSERHLVSDQRLWNGLVPFNEFVAIQQTVAAE
ncbi:MULTISPECIES: hypothetical protein [unclassified Caulobacter]|jgi:hypothetical protein|uniref:hypothetical protein n=1 Tax=unclassified Caulobacter TaxID=2648921 RepID=UPI000B0DF1CF|nr:MULTISPECIES: hypothetical protein [unclassified Caulobacter]